MALDELKQKIDKIKNIKNKLVLKLFGKKLSRLVLYYECVERITKPMKPTECFGYDDEETVYKWLRVICPKCGNEHNAYVGTIDYHCGECGQLLDMSDWRADE